MAKYKESVISGVQYNQLGKAKFVFSVNKPTRVEFIEEQVQTLGSTTDVVSKREFNLTLDEASTKFNLYDPDTSLPTGGDMSYRQLERALFSLYYTEALKADAAGTGD